ncbi:hypothetical protein PVAND_009457 [Polypedilum vanderplanki]|uniref:F-box domain-containing protein n=1 Tax=Polypedilum vanderplanki TaxID=319348 RepID=A0A9J6CCM9_POLVA|nr:hypothetical protein PVAND_009457 [Polypedilum vanderplanki]
MDMKDEQNTITTPQFDNLADECIFWKNSALKWKEKYENVKRLYAEALITRNSEPLKPLATPEKRKAKIARKTENKKNLDPFSPSVFSAEIQTAIIQHLDAKDFLKMTEVSRGWKNLLESNHILNDLDLNVNLTPKQRPPGQELLESMRHYKKLNISYTPYEQPICFDILKKFSRSLEYVVINERIVDFHSNMSIKFPKLHSLTFSSFIDNDMCKFLGRCEFSNLKVLHIRRRGANLELNIFLNEVESLTELYIAADSHFYRGLLTFMEDEEYSQSDVFLESLHIEIIDFHDDILPIEAFIHSEHSLRFLHFSGICKLVNVTQALHYFTQLKTLVLDFSTPDDDDLEMQDDDEDEDEDEIFGENADINDSLTKLVVYDIDILTMKNFKSLLFCTPHLVQLTIYSVVTRELIDFIVLSLSDLEILECCSVEVEAYEHYYQMRANNQNNSRNYNTNFEIKFN